LALTESLFNIIKSRYFTLSQQQQMAFIIYFKNWLDKLILKDEKSKVSDVKGKIMEVLIFLTKVDESFKKFFEDNIIQNVLRLLQYNIYSNNEETSTIYLLRIILFKCTKKFKRRFYKK